MEQHDQHDIGVVHLRTRLTMEMPVSCVDLAGVPRSQAFTTGGRERCDTFPHIPGCYILSL